MGDFPIEDVGITDHAWERFRERVHERATVTQIKTLLSASRPAKPNEINPKKRTKIGRRWIEFRVSRNVVFVLYPKGDKQWTVGTIWKLEEKIKKKEKIEDIDEAPKEVSLTGARKLVKYFTKIRWAQYELWEACVPIRPKRNSFRSWRRKSKEALRNVRWK